MLNPFIVIGVALLMITFGLDQLIRPRKWTHYIPSFISRFAPVDTKTLMRVHASGNVALGAFLLIPVLPVVSVIVAVIWWLSILPFAYKENWRIGARDTAITLALLSLLL